MNFNWRFGSPGTGIRFCLLPAALFLISTLGLAKPPPAPASLPLEHGDVIVFAGEAVAVEARKYGYLETALTSRFHELDLRFRNLGWQGDTVYRQDRMPNFADWETHLQGQGATLVISRFGSLEAFDGPERLSDFVGAYRQLLDRFIGVTPRLALISPLPQERLRRHQPDPARRNESLALYAEAIRLLAAEKKLPFADLFHRTLEAGRDSDLPLTLDGVLPSPYGHWRAAQALEKGFGFEPRSWQVEIGADRSASEGVQLRDVLFSQTGVRFHARDEMLPFPLYTDGDEGAPERPADERILTVRGLNSGEYLLWIDGQPVAHGSHEDWAQGIQITAGPDYTQVEKLRRLINAKNENFFQYWRPTNWDFLYGERMGVPASRRHDDPSIRWFPEEIEHYRDLITAQESEIRQLAKPVERFYELFVKPPPINSPEEELNTFTVKEGFEVNLFAAEPWIINPIAIQFDPAGRLWVLTSEDYPQVKPGEPGGGKIVILEDTNGDGRADSATVFAEGLVLPTGLALGDGGAYVAHGTELLHLKDTTGDDRADQRRVILTGFGAGDSHTNLNNLQWGPDGALYMSQGLHSHYSRIVTPHGLVLLNRDGLWRFRPRPQRLEAFLGNTTAGNNPWGSAFNHWGEPFFLNGPGGGLIWKTPALTASLGQERVFPFLPHHHLCGLDLVSGQHMPEEMDGVFVAGGYRHNDIPLFRVRDQEAGFAGEKLPSLIQSSSQTFRVVDVKTGPDGAVYLADFTQIIIGHYEFSLRDPRRDKSHGRIWRVTAKDRPLLPVINYFELSSEALFDRLKSPFHYERYQAKRVLSDRPTEEVIPALTRWVGSLDSNHPDHERHLLSALGIHVDHEVLDETLLHRLLEADHFQARALATGVIGYWHDRLPEPLDLLRARLTDEHPRVRLHAVVALGHLRSFQAAPLARLAQERPRDRFLDYALKHTLAALESQGAPVESEPDAPPKQRLARGRQLYTATCAACHQPDGRGLPGQFASLADSKWIRGSTTEALVRIVLHGKWDGELMMPPLGFLEDSDIADILTYVRSQWAHQTVPVQAEHIRQIRQDTAGRAQLWTAAELEQFTDEEEP